MTERTLRSLPGRRELPVNDRSSLINQLRIEQTDEPRAGRRWWIVVLLLALVAAAAVGWWLWRESGIVTVTVVRPQPIEAGTSAPAASVLDASGYVIARRMATVSSQSTGQLVDVRVEEGMAVTEGDVLARLDDAGERAQLALSQAQLSASQASQAEIRVQLEDARRTLQRQDELRQRGLTSQADLDSAQAAVASLEARLEASRENVQVARRQVDLRQELLDDTVIRAPFSGVVVAKAAQPGEMVSPVSAGGGFTRTGICTIVDMDSLEIEVDVNEAYIDRVRQGQPVTAILDAYPDWQIPAEVIAIVPTADRQKATVKVRVGFLERDPRILPEMGVKVRFLEEAPAETEVADQPRNLLALPASALVRAQGRDYVFIVEGDQARRRAVSVQSRRGDRALIDAGLERSAQVITSPPETLVDGTEIRIEEESQP